jgi:hypothetical protein
VTLETICSPTWRAPGAAARSCFSVEVPTSHFDQGRLQKHAEDAWSGAGLQRIPFTSVDNVRESHNRGRSECQGALAYLGRANISITLDRYGHLMPGNEGEAAELLDAYLKVQEERQAERARTALSPSKSRDPELLSIPTAG